MIRLDFMLNFDTIAPLLLDKKRLYELSLEAVPTVSSPSGKPVGTGTHGPSGLTRACRRVVVGG
jgi:hypothetical protein